MRRLHQTLLSNFARSAFNNPKYHTCQLFIEGEYNGDQLCSRFGPPCEATDDCLVQQRPFKRPDLASLAQPPKVPCTAMRLPRTTMHPPHVCTGILAHFFYKKIAKFLWQLLTTDLCHFFLVIIYHWFSLKVSGNLVTNCHHNLSPKVFDGKLSGNVIKIN